MRLKKGQRRYPLPFLSFKEFLILPSFRGRMNASVYPASVGPLFGLDSASFLQLLTGQIGHSPDKGLIPLVIPVIGIDQPGSL